MVETYEEMMQEEVEHECAKAYQAGRESMREEAAGVAESMTLKSRYPSVIETGERIAKAIRELIP